MKNLKKLVIAIAIVALLVVGVVVTAFAAADRTEVDFDRAKLYFKFVEEERTWKSKSNELALLYELIPTTVLTDEVEGFKEFREKYMASSLEIGYGLFADVESAEKTVDKINALNAVFKHFSICPIDKTSASYEQYSELEKLAYARNEALMRQLINEMLVSEDDEQRALITAIFKQAAALELDDNKWDYYIYSVKHNAAAIKSSMALAEAAARMFATAEEEALNEYKKLVIAYVFEADKAAKKEYDAYIFGIAYPEDAEAKAAEANAAYDAVIAEGGTVEDAQTAYDLIAFATYYKMYDDAMAAVPEKVQKAYDDSYAAALEAGLEEEEAAKKAEEAASAKNTELTETAAANLKEAIDGIKIAAQEVYTNTYNGIVEPKFDEAIAAYDAAYSKAYAEEYLKVSEKAVEVYEAALAAALESEAESEAVVAAYEAALAEAAENGIDDAEAYAKAKKAEKLNEVATAIAVDAYMEAIESEKQAVYDEAYKPAYESALIVLLASADKAYVYAYDATYESKLSAGEGESNATAAAKVAGKAAYDAAIKAVTDKLEAASDEDAYDAVVAEELAKIEKIAYDDALLLAKSYIPYMLTASAKAAYSKTYQSAYEDKMKELDKAPGETTELERYDVAAAFATAEAAKVYVATLAEAVVAADETITMEAAEEARKAAYDAAKAVEGTTEEEAVAAGDAAFKTYVEAAVKSITEKNAPLYADDAKAQVKDSIFAAAAEEADAIAKAAVEAFAAKYDAVADAVAVAAAEEAYNKVVFAPVQTLYDETYAKVYEEEMAKENADKAAAKSAAKAAATAAYDAKMAEILANVKYVDPIKDADFKTTFLESVSAFEKYYDGCPIVENLPSLIDEFEALDIVVKEISLNNIKFIFVEYADIPDSPNEDYPYPLNRKNAILNKVANAIEKNELDSSIPGFTDFYNEYSAAVQKYQAQYAKAKEDLDKQGDISQHGLSEGYYNQFWDFSDGKLITSYNHTGTSKGILSEDSTGNKYMTLHYGETGTHLYFEPSFTELDNGLVADFDFMVSEDFKTFSFQAKIKNVLIVANLFGMTGSNGSVSMYYNDPNGVKHTIDDMFTPNVWSHITVTYDHNTHYGNLYVNYEHIGELFFFDRGNNAYVDFQGFRIGANTTFQEVSFDNIHFFAGNCYRDYYKFTNMSESDKFKYFVDYFTDDTLSAVNRNTAYVNAKGLYENYLEDASFAEYTKYFTEAEYANYYEDYIKNPAISSNMQKINALFDVIPEINSASIASVRAAVNDIQKFVAANSDFLDRTSTEYIERMSTLTLIEAAITRAENIAEFTNILSKFDRATTLASMKRYANAAKDIYVLAGYGKTGGDNNDIYPNIDYVRDDPAAVEFEEKYGKDPFTYYADTVDVIKVREKYENSKRIIDCLGFILNMKVENLDEDGNVILDENEQPTYKYYEATEEFWAANYDYINTYIKIIRAIVSADNYDPEYEGVAEAIEEYEVINVYFYEILQSEHLEVIKTQLDRFPTTDSYIQKVGICTYVDQYIAENDIDKEREEFSALIYTLEIYKGELESQKADYKALLEQNTQYFITTINKMNSYVTYAELKPLYEEATTFYYGMNVDSREAKKAIEQYNAYGDMLEAIEENSTMFLAHVREINLANKMNGARKEEALYAALVNAMAYVDGVDKSYEGIADACETYESALLAYNTAASDINADISSINDITCAARANCISGVILAIIKNIFGN